MNESTINRMKLLDRYMGIPGLYLLNGLRSFFSAPAPLPVEINKILMIKLWGIGNLVMIIPLMRAVRRQYPNAEIHFLTLESNRKLLEPLSDLDRLITFQPQGVFKTIFDLTRIINTVRKESFDLVLDFEQFLKTTPILACLSSAHQTIGFKTRGQARSTAYNVKVPYDRDRHMSLAFGDIVRSAGINTDGLPPLQVPRAESGRIQADDFFKTLPDCQGPLIALHPGSGDNFPGRRWPSERFALLARRFVNDHGACCVLTGTAPESDLALRCERQAGAPLINAVDRFDIHGFIAFLDRVDLLVTNDTAPAHIGSALGVPLVAIYGPNTPKIYGPLHSAQRTFYDPLPCSPCLTNLNAKTSRCRIPSCILNIDPDEVYEACLDLLSLHAAYQAQPRSGDDR